MNKNNISNRLDSLMNQRDIIYEDDNRSTKSGKSYSSIMSKTLIEKATRMASEREKDNASQISAEKVLNSITDEGLKNFKSDIQKYSEIEVYMERLKEKQEPLKKQLKPLLDHMKLLKSKKTDIEQQILTFMESHGIEHCNLPPVIEGEANGSLSFATRNTKASMNEKTVKDRIYTFFKTQDVKHFNGETPEKKTEVLHDFIYNKIPKVTKTIIKKGPYMEPMACFGRDIDDYESE